MSPRPKRKKLKFDEDSVNSLLQEIYDDTHNIRAQIKRLFIKWEQKVKEGGEIAAIGDQIVKIINAEAKNQDQKIMVLKYLKDIVFDKNNNNNNDDSEDKNTVTQGRRDELIQMVENHTKETKKKDTNKN